MNKTVVALYDDRSSAENAVKELVDRGFAREEISTMTPGEKDGEYVTENESRKEGAAVGAGIGATLGGIGGLLIGAGALFIPGVGPVIAAGPVVAMLASAGVGAAVGGVTGGLLGALVDMDIPEEQAHSYAEGIRRGGSLVTVRTTQDRADQAVQILNRHDPINIDERMDEWRQSGWSRFDPSEPYHENRVWPRQVAGDVEYQDNHDLPEDLEPAYDSDKIRDFDNYEPSFRDHFDMSRYRNQYTYDEFRPAYYYGYTLAVDDEYRDLVWEDIEPEAQRYWEDREPGTWDRFKDSVRLAWEDIKEAVR